MIISLNWLKKFVDIDMPVDELAILIGERLVEIEEVIDLGAKYKDALIVRVVEANKLDGSDHLSVIKIDDGGVKKNLDRDKNGFIQVVCGAPNIKANQTVVWLPPESVVPETFGDPEPFVLDSRNLRGVMSHGMIASARELSLFDEHDGILELDDNFAPGTAFASAYELDDYLLNIENKSLTHRPDCFGIIGFAREVSAITGKQFKSPDWIMNLAPYFGENTKEIKVKIDDTNLSGRYQAIVMTDGDGKKHSPLLIQTYLARVGVKPISSVVDVTNYLMMLTGQPLHAFDFDKMAKVAGNTYDYEIHVRAGRDKENLELLDGRIIELTTEDIVISAGDVAVGLAGAMGGMSTVIDENTKSIILECATFNLYKLRSTQMRHGIFSEAITRFTKGQPAELTAPVLSEAVRLIGEWSGARIDSALVDVYPEKTTKPGIELTLDQVNSILGRKYNIDELKKSLENSEFEYTILDGDYITIKPPYWRPDINIVEDIIEEIGRLNGFDNIDPILPIRNFDAIKPNSFDIFKNKIRKILTRAGSNEVLNYSFTHGDIISNAKQDISNSYKIINSISPDLQYYRQTLTPSLLSLVNLNIRQGYDNFALYELNRIHQKSDGLSDENVPNEKNSIAFVITNKNNKTGSTYYKAKYYVDYLCKTINCEIDYKPIEDSEKNPLFSPFEYKHSAKIISKKSNELVGIVGEYKKSVSKYFKLPASSAGFEINSEVLFNESINTNLGYKPVCRFPITERDVCFNVDDTQNYGQIINILEKVKNNEEVNIEIVPIDIYKANNSTKKNITIRFRLSSNNHTMNSDEINNILTKLVEAVTSSIDVAII